MAPTNKPKVIRLEITIDADGVPERELLSRALTVCTPRGADKAITFADAFETVGLTVTDVSPLRIGEGTPSSDDVFDVGQRWYNAEVRAIAKSILEELKTEIARGTWSGASRYLRDEWLNEKIDTTCGDHNWIIYTAKARLVNAMTNSPDGWRDVMGDTPDDILTDEQRAFYSLRADVTDAVGFLRAEYDDEDDDEDETDDE